MKKMKKAGLFAAILGSLVLPVSCGGDGEGGEDQAAAAPEIVGVSPEDGTADLVVSSLDVIFSFDQNVKCPSSGHSLVTVDGGAVIDKVFSYGKDVTVSLSGLERGTSYTLAIPEGVISGYQDNPAAAITYRFSTKAAEKDYARNPASSLTNPSATAGAKALYAFLLKNYGSKTVSGAMGGTAWETSYTDMIAEKTGIYPGIVGFDYLFLNWPPKSWSSCPDYGDIIPVLTAWKAGNIIQIGWHWTVPSVEGETDLDKYSYATRQFGVEAALTGGTWQNALIKTQIEKLAGYMKLLQDAGIPVLFRPLHEAAGDYTWGAWFWWGYDGADACVRLWKYLRSELQDTYGLNNLVWVWTVQTKTSGAVNFDSLDTAREWYPGDDWVDIVGADLYESKGASMTDAFRFVNNSVEGKKMVVLSEFGNLPDVSGSFSEDAPWGYFMNWCNFENDVPVLYSKNSDGSYGWNNTADEWKAALSDSHTLNRKDIDF